MPLKRVEDHFLVPRHEILAAGEAEALLTKLGTDKGQLAQISKADPVMESLEAQKGDIIKITRRSPTAGKAVYYRVVV